MPCGTSTFVSGTYSATLSGGNLVDGNHDLGTTDDGFEIEWTHSIQEITTDRWGDTVVDGIYRGGNCFINATFLEWSRPAVEELRAAYTDDGVEGSLGTIGCTVYDNSAYSLVLTRVSPAGATNSPDIYSFGSVILDPNFPIRWALQSRLWTLPIRFRALPNKTSGVIYTITE